MLAARAYAAAKQIYEHAPDRRSLPESIWIDRVKETDFRLMEEAHDRPAED